MNLVDCLPQHGQRLAFGTCFCTYTLTGRLELFPNTLLSENTLESCCILDLVNAEKITGRNQPLCSVECFIQSKQLINSNTLSILQYI